MPSVFDSRSAAGSLTSLIRVIRRNVSKVQWNLDRGERFRGHSSMPEISLSDLPGGLQVEYLGMDILEREREEVVSGVDLQIDESRKTEVGGCTGEDEWDGLVEVACCLDERGVGVECETGYSRDGEG